jgi:hypothetical protein
MGEDREQVVERFTAEIAEYAEKKLGILGDLGALCG